MCVHVQDVPRYKRLDCRTQLRMSQALKHIASLQMPDKSPVYGRSGLHEAIAQLQSSPALRYERGGQERGAGEGIRVSPRVQKKWVGVGHGVRI